MAFWSSQKLEQELPTLIKPLINYDPSRIESASYTLRIGREIFVTKDHHNSNNEHARRVLEIDQDFDIPPGQFAFLLTEETVKVPNDAIAFISMKAGIKYKGLVNISGFHVDPGFEGKLLFSVYNAGPSRIRLSHNQACFLIWYASLDGTDEKPRNIPGYTSFPRDVLDKISTDKIYSLQALTEGFREVEFNVSQKVAEINSIKKEIDFITWGIRIALGIIFAFAIYSANFIISIGKFAIEQREAINNVIEYAKNFDDYKNTSGILEKQHKGFQLLSEKQATIEAELNILKKHHSKLFKNESKNDPKPK